MTDKDIAWKEDVDSVSSGLSGHESESNPHSGSASESWIKQFGLGEDSPSEITLQDNTSQPGQFFTTTSTEAGFMAATSNSNNIAIGVDRTSGGTDDIWFDHTWANDWQGRATIWNERNFSPSDKLDVSQRYADSEARSAIDGSNIAPNSVVVEDRLNIPVYSVEPSGAQSGDIALIDGELMVYK